jgi:hypothetical protein
MADQSDVEDALARLIAAALYPDGTDAPSAIGHTSRVFRGWPNAGALDGDLAAGRVNITVFAEARHQRNTTRWAEEWQMQAVRVPTFAVAVAGHEATIAGTGGAGMLVGLQVDTLSVVHRTLAGETAELVAASLADKLRALGRVALASGAVVRVPGAGFLLGRVVADQAAMRETKRQSQDFRISLWCPDAASRDAAGSLVDRSLSALNFLPLADGAAGRLRFVSSLLFDQSVNARLYRRDLVYAVEYPTTVIEALPEMIFGLSDVTANGTTIVNDRVS